MHNVDVKVSTPGVSSSEMSALYSIIAVSLAWQMLQGVLICYHDRCAVPLRCASARHWKPQWCQHSVAALQYYAKRRYASARRPEEISAAT